MSSWELEPQQDGWDDPSSGALTKNTGGGASSQGPPPEPPPESPPECADEAEGPGGATVHAAATERPRPHRGGEAGEGAKGRECGTGGPELVMF